MTRPPTAKPRLHEVRRRFDRAASDYDDADFLPRHTGDGLLERIAPVTVEARHVLNLGAATGSLSRQLHKRFPKSRVLNLDLSAGMLRKARRKRSWLSRAAELQGDAAALPLAGGSIDVVIANLLLPWVADPPAVFAEIARVLRKEGLFAFSALGPDSLGEIRSAFGDDADLHVRRFADMHDIGDALLAAGLHDPVLDVERLRIDYADSGKLFRDLTAGGARNSLHGRQKTLTGRRRFEAFRERLGDDLSVGMELVYGHAFGGGGSGAAGEFRFDVADLGRRRR